MDDISIEFVIEALDQVAIKGFDIPTLLASSNIPLELLATKHAAISPAQFARLWHQVVAATRDEFFLMDPRGMPAGSYTILCHAVLHSPNLDRALRRALRLFAILLSDLDFRIERDGESVDIVFLESGGPRSAFAYGTILVLLFGLLCWLIDTRIAFVAIELRSPPPAAPDRYRALLDDNLRFGCAQTRVRFDASYLTYQPRRTEEQMRRFLRDAPENCLVRYRNCDSVAAKIRGALRVSALEAWPSFQEISRKLDMTPSTLRRRLGDEGSSYQMIKDDVRREQAIHHLKLGIKSNAEIAAEVGFREPSTFYRAFKKWTGFRPRDFRPVRSEAVAADQPS